MQVYDGLDEDDQSIRLSGLLHDFHTHTESIQ